MFTPVKQPGPPPELQASKLKQWLQSTFQDHATILRGLTLADSIATPAYGPTVPMDLSKGGVQKIVATDGNPFTISAPTNIGPLSTWTLTINNNTTGPLGVVTFDPSIQQLGFSDPGPGGTASATFWTDGTNSYQLAPWQGSPPSIYMIPYSASMTPDLSKANIQMIVATDGNPFTINAPINNGSGYWEMIIRNASSGALGAVTFDPSIKQDGFADPGAGRRTSAFFHQEGNVTHQDTPWTSGNVTLVQVSLSTAQIQGMNTTPVQLVAAPGSGLFIAPVRVSFSASAGGFSGTGNIKLGYGSGLGTIFFTQSTALLTGPGGIMIPSLGLTTVFSAAALVNQGFYVSGGPYTGGSGTLEVGLSYYVAEA